MVWLAITGAALAVLGIAAATEQNSFESAHSSATVAPLGEAIFWQEGDASGSVTPLREGTNGAGRLCREFQQVITIGGREEMAYGTTCRDADGSWQFARPGE